jgi:hypothetical protein
MPEDQKKFVFYVVIVLAALIMGAFSLFSLKNSIANLSASISAVRMPPLENSADTTNSETASQTQTAVDQKTSWQAYIDKQQNFLMAYPDGWTVTRETSDGSEVWLEKKSDTDVANLHLEVASITQHVKTAEEGIDKSISQLKATVKPKTSIHIGQYEGYETIGTVCVKNCTATGPREYAPFSMVYFNADGKVFKIKYAEGVIGQGWDTDWNSWKSYNEFQKMLSTFTLIK